MPSGARRPRVGTPRGRGKRPSRIFAALVGIVLVAPLAFGAYPTWAWGSLAVGTGLLLVAWGAQVVAGRRPVARFPARIGWTFHAFCGVLLWAVFQTLPYSPEAMHHPLWGEAARAMDAPYWGAVTVDPSASWHSIARLVTYAAVFWLAAQFGRGASHASTALQAVALAAAGYAAYGLVVEFAGANKILWFDKTSYFDVVTATFVNRNSFATFAGLGLLCASAVLHRRLAAGAAVGGYPLSWRDRLGELIKERLPRSGLFLGAWLVLATALLLTESRGGVLATVAGVAVFFGAAEVSRYRQGSGAVAPSDASGSTRQPKGRARRDRRRGSLGGIAALAVVAATVFGISGGPLQERMWRVGVDSEHRSTIYRHTADAIRDAPLKGTGLGTFGSVFDLYGTQDVGPGVAMAHNDYLEVALELGIPAAVVLVAALGALAVNCGIGAIGQRDPAVPAVGLAACVLVGVHALVDFSLQLPGVAATFALVLGAAVGQCYPTSGERPARPRASP